MKIDKNWSLNKEIYAIADLNDEYIALVVAVYQDSQFYIVFNERRVLPKSTEVENDLKFLTEKGKLLEKLVKKAQTSLNLKISEVSYNLPVDQIKITPQSHFYQFQKPVIFTPQILKETNNKFLKSYEKDNEYQNFLFRINQYGLLDERKLLTKPPYGQVVGSIKISGHLYQVKWKQLYRYLQIFKTAKVKQFRPIMLPYAIHVNLNFLEKTKNSILVWWNKNNCQIFVFTNKVLTQCLTLPKGLKEPIDKISEKINQDRTETENYLYNLLNLNDKTILDQFKLFTHLEKKELQEIRKNIFQIITNFIENTVKEIEFIIEEKLKLVYQKNTIFVFGQMTEISGLEEYLKKLETKSEWKIHNNTFIGLKDGNDLFLIGNAYYQHLQKKLLYNQDKETQKEDMNLSFSS